jgi:phosphohistidine phosphatase SixA
MEETRRAAESLVKILKAEKFKIFTSPWTRALQTAEILAEVSSSAVEVFDGLIPPTELSKIQSKINETRGSIVFVGHNPDLSQIVCELMGANLDSISLKKAGVAILNRTGYDAWELEHLLTRSDLLRFSR